MAQSVERKTLTVKGELIAGPEQLTLEPVGCQLDGIKYPQLEFKLWIATFWKDAEGQKTSQTVHSQLNHLVKAAGMSFDFIPGLSDPVPSKLDGRRRLFVVLTGELYTVVMKTPDPGNNDKSSFLGRGHMGRWPAEILLKELKEATIVWER